MRRLATSLDTEGGVRFLWWLIGGSIIVGFIVFVAVGANGPKDPALAPRQGVPGFGTIAFSIEHGAVTDDFCALLAADDTQRQTGMMGRRDFGGYDAMVFAFPTAIDPKQVYFYNRRVPIALSVAWFDGQGQFVSTNDLEPCADIDTCPTIRATKPFKFALEVAKGGFGRLGVGPGSALRVGNSGC